MKATISVATTIYTDEGDDGMELVTVGDYSYGGGVIRLGYDETELTGMQGTHTSFEVRGTEAIMKRSGTVSSQVLFRPGETHQFAYRTPDGMLTMSIDTIDVSNQLSVSGGSLELYYGISVQGTGISRNKVSINVRRG